MARHGWKHEREYNIKRKRAKRAELTRQKVRAALLKAISTKPCRTTDLQKLIDKVRHYKHKTKPRISDYLDHSEHATLLVADSAGFNNQIWVVEARGGFKQWIVHCLPNETTTILSTLKRKMYEESESWPPGPLRYYKENNSIWWAEPSTDEDWPEDWITEEGRSYYNSRETSAKKEQS